MDGEKSRRIGTHLDRSEFHEPQSAVGHEGIEEFINADFRLMRVAMEIEQ